MATFTPAWTIAQSVSLNTSVGNGGTDTVTINAAAGGYDIIDVHVNIGFFGSPDGPAQVQVFSSVDSGVTLSNIPDIQFNISQVTCTNQIKPIKGLVGPFHVITVTNSDSADGIHSTITYAGRQWQSA